MEFSNKDLRDNPFKIKKATGAFGNRLEFYTGGHMHPDCITVADKDCQLERTYRIGATQTLDDFEMVEITSHQQVIDAWSNGKVHF